MGILLKDVCRDEKGCSALGASVRVAWCDNSTGGQTDYYIGTPPLRPHDVIFRKVFFFFYDKLIT